MDNHLVVLANGPWYELFYNLAFIVCLFIYLVEGNRRKFPMLKWVFLLVFTQLLFIFGSKVVTFSTHDFYLLLTRFQLPESQNKSLAGGLLFGGIGFVAGIAFLRFKQNIADAFALAIPAGIAVQRLGCFAAGCCHGRISDLPWAVKYPAQTLPHFHQFNENLITNNDFLSLPVHPVQLYEMAGLLAVVFVIFKLRNAFKAKGSLALLSFILIFMVRFVSEFFRDPAAHTIGGKMFMVFNTTQLVLVPLTLLFIFILWKREKTGQAATSATATDFNPAFAFLLFLILTTCFRALKNWFTLPEVMVLTVTFIVAYTLLGFRIFQKLYYSPYRWLYLAGFIIPLILTAQTYPTGEQDSVFVKKYKTLKIGLGTGDFENSYSLGQGEGCDRVSNTQYFRQQYTLGGAAIEFTEERPELKQQFRYGAEAMIGKHTETRLSDNMVNENTLFGITPYLNFETNWFGIGGGLHVGNLAYAYENISDDGTGIPKSGVKEVNVYPQLYLRTGPQRWFFVDYRLADHFPSSFPGIRQQLGIGTGLGTKNGTRLRLGFNLYEMYYFTGYVPIENRIVIEPMIIWGKSPQYDADNKNFYQYSVSVGYRFGFSEGEKLKKKY
jgi:phosphatidylglycerol:prolipoprotein diacylglycerol transferase